MGASGTGFPHNQKNIEKNIFCRARYEELLLMLLASEKRLTFP
jgi:hypothetical protein